MGKKKKGRKGRSKYNKKQFIDIYCLNCELCSTYPPEPIFCYEELYKTDPSKFLETCFIGLMREARKMKESNTSGRDITIKKFRELFCESFCEKEDCGLIVDCFNLFKDQIDGMNKKSRMRQNKKKKQKQRKQYICQPYPTMFTNDNEDWKIRIENILSNGNNYREQDKVKKSTKQLEGQVD